MAKREASDPGYWCARAVTHLRTLCSGRDRRPGSVDNVASTTYVSGVLTRAGWAVDQQEFEVVDWEGGAGVLTVSGVEHRVQTSPYSIGVEATGRLTVVGTLDELASRNLAGAIVLLRGDLTSQPLTPKAFPFYQVDEHTKLIALLEESHVAALVAATGSCPEAAGAVSPFPFVEDGDFLVPAAYVDEQTGAALARHDGALASIALDGQRRLAMARNVIGRRGDQQRRITVVAHVHTKVGTPGAVDNAAGVTALLLLAEMLSDQLPIGVELLVVNGEDYYNAAGEVQYLRAYEAQLDNVALAVNLDGVGYHEGPTAYSLYGCEDAIALYVRRTLESHRLVEGPQWWQSDHAVFAMRGRPAVALTSARTDLILQEVAHSARDTVQQVDERLLVQASEAICSLIVRFPRTETGPLS